jgi:hypothetical protein
MRPDDQRSCRRSRGIRVKVNPAIRAELGLLPDHAGLHAVDIGNLLAAQPKRVAGARLLLLAGVGPARDRPHQKAKRYCRQQQELKIPGPGGKGEHESPKRCLTNCG